MPLPFIFLFSTSLALEWQRQWLEFWLGAPRHIRVQGVVINLDDFRKGKSR